MKRGRWAWHCHAGGVASVVLGIAASVQSGVVSAVGMVRGGVDRRYRPGVGANLGVGCRRRPWRRLGSNRERQLGLGC
jgi:hypothetical protein